MKNPGRTVVLATLLALASSGCSPSPDRSAAADAPSVSGSVLAAGARHYDDWACGICHGERREGLDGMGPPLRELSEHWTVDRLSAYLLDPESFRKSDPHVQQRDREYPDAMMPAFDFPEDERRALAAWLLD